MHAHRPPNKHHHEPTSRHYDTWLRFEQTRMADLILHLFPRIVRSPLSTDSQVIWPFGPVDGRCDRHVFRRVRYVEYHTKLGGTTWLAAVWDDKRFARLSFGGRYTWWCCSLWPSAIIIRPRLCIARTPPPVPFFTILSTTMKRIIWIQTSARAPPPTRLGQHPTTTTVNITSATKAQRVATIAKSAATT